MLVISSGEVVKRSRSEERATFHLQPVTAELTDEIANNICPGGGCAQASRRNEGERERGRGGGAGFSVSDRLCYPSARAGFRAVKNKI